MMAKKRNSEWLDIKELMPLQFMPYVAGLFRRVTGTDLQGLSQFTRWIGPGGYYHWRLAQQGLVHHVPHLSGQPMPRAPDAHPSGKPLPLRSAQTETPPTGASGRQQGKTKPTPDGSRQGPTSNKGGQAAPPGQGGMTTTPRQGRASCQSSEPASTSKNGAPATPGGPSHLPSDGGGAGDGSRPSWYEWTLHVAQEKTSGPSGPPNLLGSAEAR